MVTFTACRSKPELVVPARGTPRELRSLSDVDNQPVLRIYMTIVEFFWCRNPGGAPEHLSSSLKAAMAEALVHYYPMAGRLRELPGGKKLVLNCSAEGGLFVDARANVRLEEFPKPLVPPYPCIEELICDVGDVTAVIGKPLIYLQMTQLTCGGVVLAFTMCHSLVDGIGFMQIVRCILDLARGQALPQVFPVWERHLLSSSVPSTASNPAGIKEVVAVSKKGMQSISLPVDHMVIRSFLFGPREIAAMRSRVPGSFTVFELITAAVWRCRVAALEYAPPEKRVQLMFAINARGSWKREPPLPQGFYGNAFFMAAAETSADELCRGPLARTVELLRDAKLKITEEHVMSVVHFLARDEFSVLDPLNGPFNVSDMSRFGDDSLELGSWAELAGGGTLGVEGMFATMSSIYMKCKDVNGDECVAVPMCLPELAMSRFMSQIAAVTSKVARSCI